jgi:MSHA biogenesis protein MshJ
MSTLRERLESLSQWFNQRPLRERVMLAVCLLVVVFFFWDQLLLKPLDRQTRTLRTRTVELNASLAELQAQEQVIRARRDFDPDRDNKLRLEDLSNQVQRLKQQLEENVATLVSPQQMRAHALRTLMFR